MLSKGDSMTDHGLRKTPKQERGEQRIIAILDAAEQTFAEVGMEAATTNAIAARAQTSIGSLYQFFPNKEAIIQKLAERYAEELSAMHDRVFFPEITDLPLAGVVDHIIDPIVTFRDEHRAFRALFVGAFASQQLTAAIRALDEELIGRIIQLFAGLPQLRESERRRYAIICLQIVRALLSIESSPQGLTQEEVIIELKRVLVTYIMPLVREKHDSDGELP
jgi:AcrR family transcriptional regulator